jgi:hypothetical protein
MAYKQSGLKNIGGIKDKILKKRLGKNNVAKQMSLEEMKYKANIGNFKDQGPRTFYRGKGSSVETFTEGTGKGWMKSDKKINPKISERRSRSNELKTNLSIKSDKVKSNIKESASTVGKGLKFGAVELGHKALDVIPGTGKRRIFVGANLESGGQDRVFGSDEAGHHKRFRFGGVKSDHYPRMSNKKWRQTKKANYTVGQRVGNIANKIAFRVATTGITGGMAIGLDAVRNQGRGVEKIKKAAKQGIKNLRKFI